MWDYMYATRAQHIRDNYQVQIHVGIIIYQIYQLVGGFSANFLSSRISRNIFFHMIGTCNESFHFIFWEGGISKTGLYLQQRFVP